MMKLFYTLVIILTTLLHYSSTTISNITLLDGEYNREGRLLLNIDNIGWSTLYDSTFTYEDATVVCKTLGYTSASQSFNYSEAAGYFGAGDNDSVSLSAFNLDCTGEEANINYCSMMLIDDTILSLIESEYSHDTDIGVVCDNGTEDEDLRLYGTAFSFEGRVEIYHNNSWGTVCYTGIDLNTASVICRQLGYDNATSFWQSALLIPESTAPDPIWIVSLRCDGDESVISECYYEEVYDYSTTDACTHTDDLGLSCYYDTTTLPLRLSDVECDTSPTEGRIEVYYNREWGVVYGGLWEDSAARVVCRDIGYNDGVVSDVTGSSADIGVPMWILSASCTSYESVLAECTLEAYLDFTSLLSDTSAARVECATMEPSGSPTDVEISSLSDNKFYITWAPPSCSERNGVINGYTYEWFLYLVLSDGGDTEFVVSGEGDTEMTSVYITSGESIEDGVEYGFKVRIKAYTSAGSGPYSSWTMYDTTTTDSNNILTIILLSITIVILILIILTLILLGVIKFKLTKQQQRYDDRFLPLNNLSVPSITPEPSPTERYVSLEPLITRLKPEQLVVTDDTPIGEGCFGCVMKGCLYPTNPDLPPRIVAVKKIKRELQSDEVTAFWKEAELMARIGRHPNVIELVGVCEIDNVLHAALDYATHGDLRTYLRLCRNQQESADIYQNKEILADHLKLTMIDLLKYALDVSRGMEHLSSHDVIHRDLAARNVLVTDNHVCKVSDFGLARDDNRIYVMTTKRPVPIRWMAIESLIYDVYTVKSDVWSYGVLLWEIITLGGTPYYGTSNTKIVKQVRDGARLSQPLNCDDPLFKLMWKCWYESPRDRPQFAEITFMLRELIAKQQQDDDYMVPVSNRTSNYANIDWSEDTDTNTTRQSVSGCTGVVLEDTGKQNSDDDLLLVPNTDDIPSSSSRSSRPKSAPPVPGGPGQWGIDNPITNTLAADSFQFTNTPSTDRDRDRPYINNNGDSFPVTEL